MNFVCFCCSPEMEHELDWIIQLIRLGNVWIRLGMILLYRDYYYNEIHCNWTSSRDSQNPRSVIYELCFSSLLCQLNKGTDLNLKQQ